MIASIQGTIADTQNNSLVIVVNGIGYQVFVPHSVTERRDSDEIFLHTSLIVREDSLTLYGFPTLSERDLFETLLKVNGIGPKVALSILSHISLDNLHAAIHNDKPDILMRVPGIGKKTAQKIALELKDKLHIGLDFVPSEDFTDINAEVMDALVALGYSIIEAQTAIQALPKDAPQNVEDRIRLSLQFFA